MKRITAVATAIALLASPTSPAIAHKLRSKGEAAAVADSSLTITPSRDWNRLSGNVGKNTETWTIDGEQLNDLTFFGGIEAGKPLVRERHKKRAPLPKFQKSTLLAEIPELLEGTYRTDKNIGTFRLTSTEPARFLGQDGVMFTYEYTDEDQITRKGEATAAIVAGKLYMVSFDAPRLHYFDKTIGDVRALVATARL
ncbi:MAG: hypothetical protein EOP61_05345 [Sphingomonadales bacterium]|nr:MAG: hypothetical protein EOP61_05345 [Sphingomonadales bacterium]